MRKFNWTRYVTCFHSSIDKFWLHTFIQKNGFNTKYYWYRICIVSWYKRTGKAKKVSALFHCKSQVTKYTVPMNSKKLKLFYLQEKTALWPLKWKKLFCSLNTFKLSVLWKNKWISPSISFKEEHFSSSTVGS